MSAALSETTPFSGHQRAAGLYGLAPSERHRLLVGLAHLDTLGRRAKAEFWLEALGLRLTLGDVLARLDDWRAGLTPEMVRAAGGDRSSQMLSLATPR